LRRRIRTIAEAHRDYAVVKVCLQVEPLAVAPETLVF